MKVENKEIIYFDNAATTVVDPLVLAKYYETQNKYFANPSSIHKLGQEAYYLLNNSKEDILSLLRYKDGQVVYLSGATEANNLAIKGVALRYQNRGNHLITSIYEHPSVLEAFKQLEEHFGFKVTYLTPNKDGVITPEKIKESLTDKTILVSLMAVNNEIGSINPIEEIATLLKGYPKVIFHVDASQAIGKIEINCNDVDLFTISAHKMHGLVGFGALVKKKKIDLLSLNSGGGQEYGYRSGTEDLANAIAFKLTLEESLTHLKERYLHVKELSDRLLSYLSKHEDLFELNTPNEINPYVINFSSLTKKGSVIVEALSNANIMVSSVSACHSSKEVGSYVVKSLGKSEKAINNTIRVSFSYMNTLEEVDILISTLDKIIGDIR